MPAVFAAGVEIAQILVCLSLLSCWTHLDTPVPDHKMSLSRNVASALIRRRSEQVLSRLRRFLNFSGFSAVWTCKSSRLITQKFCSFNGCFRTESRSMLDKVFWLCRRLKCDGYQVHSKLPPELVKSAMCLAKAVITYLVQQKV